MMDSNRDTALEEIIQSNLKDAVNWYVRVHNELGSTMDSAKEELPSIVQKGRGIILAKRQLSGRGRHGREWQSTPEAFLGTFVFPVSRESQQLGGLSLAMGCSVHRAMMSLGAQVYLKWPNDIVASDKKKLGGILIEVVVVGSVHVALVGIGINLIQGPIGVEGSALKTVLGRGVTIEELTKGLSPTIWDDFCLFQKSGFDVFKERWLGASIMLGSTVQIETGTEILTGRMVGVSPIGQLLLEVNGKIREVSTGHVISF